MACPPVHPVGVPDWVEQGPQPFVSSAVLLGDVAAKTAANGAFVRDKADLVAGAIEAVAVQPMDPNTNFCGGVARTGRISGGRLFRRLWSAGLSLFWISGRV